MSVSVPREEPVEPGFPLRLTSRTERPIGIEELFRRHSAAIASVGLAMLQSVEEADDLVQDVFLRAWGALDRLEDPDGARPWLMTIAVRLARTRLRRRRLTQLLFRFDAQEVEQVASPGALPEHRELMKRLQIILDKMPVELRIAWVLRYVQAETVQSVAELCGWSMSTAKRRIQEAHERVTKTLDAPLPRPEVEP